MTAAPHDAYASLRIPPFRWFVLSLVAMTLATQVQALVVAWQIYGITRDPLSLGLIGLAEAAPFIATALFAGHVADRADRRGVALAALAVLSACAAALLGLSSPASPFGPRAVGPFYAVIALSGLARAFLVPSRNALQAELVPRALYPNASAWRTSAWQSAAVGGPALGGVLYAVSGPRLAYAVDLGLLVVGIACLALVDAPRRRAPATEPVLRSLRGGLEFVRREPVLLGALTLDLFSVLFGGAVALLPVYASDILRVGAEGLGVLRAAPAVGAVLMSLWLAHRPPFQRAGFALLASVAVFGAAIIGFGVSRVFILSVLLLVASGMADTVSVVIRATLVQEWTPDALLGRVSAVNAIFIGSSNELGAFESGLAARLLGTVTSVVFGGTMTLLIVGLTAWRNGPLRSLGAIRSRRQD